MDTELGTALYIVIQSGGKWYVDFEGRANGPHADRDAAALEARDQAQFMAHMGRASEVLVPDMHGKYWVVWASRDVQPANSGGRSQSAA